MKDKKVKILLNLRKKTLPHSKRQYNISAEVIHPFTDNHTPFDVFSVVTNLDPLLKYIKVIFMSSKMEESSKLTLMR